MAPLLEPLLAVASASLDEAGTLLEANAGFRRLIDADLPQPIGANVAEFFIQPSFASLLRASTATGGNIHQGLLTVGHYAGLTRSLRGRVWREGAQLRLLAEYDIADLERLNATVLDLNRDYADAQAQLARTNLEVRRLNTELERRVEERTRALREALLRVEASSRAKSAFLANMSHEFRTPLNTILGLGYIVGAKLVEPGQRTQVEMIMHSGQQLLKLVDQVLEMSALELEDFHLEAADFALPALLGEVLGAWGERADPKGLILAQEFDPALPPWLHGDAPRLRRMLATLAGNAVKFSERGRVTLRARLVGSNGDDLRVRFEVEDQGVGIDAEQQAAVFSAFEQADNSFTRRHGGLGLGLALCKRLAQRMGGEIGVKSTLGQGSTFWIAVPLRRGIDSGQAEACRQTEPAKEPPSTSQAAGALPRTVPPDPGTVSALLDELDALLAQNDTEAISLFEQHAPALRASVGAPVDQLGHEIGRFEFAAARETLRAIHGPPRDGP